MMITNFYGRNTILQGIPSILSAKSLLSKVEVVECQHTIHQHLRLSRRFGVSGGRLKLV